MEAYEMLELCREALARDSQDPSALAMMKWLSDSKLPTSDYVTVPANSPTAGCEACGYKFLFASSTKCPSCGDPREAIVADGYDFLTANTVPIMDSTVGLKAANAHLTRQLAAQALAHAEQMEGLKEDREKARRENVAIGDLYATATVRASKLETEVTNWQDAWAKERDFWRAQMQYQLSAIRVTPTTQPTDAQQTTGDVKVAKEPKAFPAGALKAGGSDPRRMGP